MSSAKWEPFCLELRVNWLYHRATMYVKMANAKMQMSNGKWKLITTFVNLSYWVYCRVSNLISGDYWTCNQLLQALQKDAIPSRPPPTIAVPNVVSFQIKTEFQRKIHPVQPLTIQESEERWYFDTASDTGSRNVFVERGMKYMWLHNEKIAHQHTKCLLSY